MPRKYVRKNQAPPVEPEVQDAAAAELALQARVEKAVAEANEKELPLLGGEHGGRA